VAAEESGNIEDAIAHYTETLVYADSFPQAAKAQFAIGRLREEQQNKEAAIEAYREVIAKWPSETIWINLANSRIIALSGLNS
jgi:tetratricopeptide (TPR) repeat protein